MTILLFSFLGFFLSFFYCFDSCRSWRPTSSHYCYMDNACFVRERQRDRDYIVYNITSTKSSTSSEHTRPMLLAHQSFSWPPNNGETRSAHHRLHLHSWKQVTVICSLNFAQRDLCTWSRENRSHVRVTKKVLLCCCTTMVSRRLQARVKSVASTRHGRCKTTSPKRSKQYLYRPRRVQHRHHQPTEFTVYTSNKTYAMIVSSLNNK